MVEAFIGIIEMSLIFGILALGSYISYKILNFPDLSVEGTFPLGAAVSAILIINGWNPYLSCVMAFFAGALGGMATGIINVRFKITDLLSGIIVLTAMYSINLVVAGRSNLPIFEYETIFSHAEGGSPYFMLLTAFIVFMCIKISLDMYLKTKSGFLLRSVGDNVSFATSLAKDAGKVKILGLALANGLAALSGAVWCQYQRVFDVSMGSGIIIIGVASTIIGVNVFRKLPFFKDTTKVLFGCIVYNFCIAIAIFSGIRSELMYLVTAILFLVALMLNNGSLTGRRKT